jgi:hypothetical protein
MIHAHDFQKFCPFQRLKKKKSTRAYRAKKGNGKSVHASPEKKCTVVGKRKSRNGKYKTISSEIRKTIPRTEKKRTGIAPCQLGTYDRANFQREEAS